MEVIVKEEARQDLAELDKEIRDRILENMEEDRNSKLNHRIFYQIKDNKVYIRGVFHRQKGYGTEIEKELKERS